MPTLLHDVTDPLAAFEQCARRGEWSDAVRFAGAVANEPPPVTIEAVAERLKCLRQALIVARVARADLAATQLRIRAAAGFMAG